jgi:universal stress protein A
MKKAITKNTARGRRPGSATPPTVRGFTSILVPIDFSDYSRRALQYAARTAREFEATLILVNVIEPMVGPDFFVNPLTLEKDEVTQRTEGELKTLAERERVAELVERTLVRYGTPFAEITGAARTLKVDLIVIATHGYTGMKRVLMGSTAERVVRHAHCPVLVVR